jgi:hypothetical protein
MDVLADCIDTYNVPEDERFELMCRIRAAQALLPGREEQREKLVIARLLATAIFVHTHPEAQTASALFLYEPDLIPHVAELLALDRNVPIGSKLLLWLHWMRGKVPHQGAGRFGCCECGCEPRHTDGVASQDRG